MDADAGGAFDDAGSDLKKLQAEGGKLCLGERVSISSPPNFNLLALSYISKVIAR